jgi:flagellar FliL protein
MAREDKKPAAETPAAKPKKKLLLVVGAAVMVLALVGGGAWYFMKGKSSGDEQKASTTLSAVPLFIPLDPFTVNLQREEGDRVLQVGLSLKIYNADLPEKVKAAMPEIRSNLLLLLSSKHASELVSVEGKKKLANEIIVAVDAILGIVPPAPKPATAGNTAATPAVAPAGPAPAPAGEGTSGVQPVAAAEVATAPAPAPAAAPAPAPAPDAPAEAKPATEPREGIVGVLFTSFIIQ